MGSEGLRGQACGGGPGAAALQAGGQNSARIVRQAAHVVFQSQTPQPQPLLQAGSWRL